MKNKTTVPKKNTIEKKWYLIDAKGQKIGSLSTFIAGLLMGKHKTNFVSFLDCADNVVVINAASSFINPKVKESKLFFRYSGYPSGLKGVTLDALMKKNPIKVIEHSVKGMLPKNKLADVMMGHLFVYNEDVHPHQAQKPELITIKK